MKRREFSRRTSVRGARRGAPAAVLAALVLALSAAATGDTDPGAQDSLEAAAAGDLVRLLHDLPPGSPLNFPDGAFMPLAGELAAARVVGLGEATHGTREFFEFKHRTFRYLVENCGHRALAYEFSFARSVALDEYVTGGGGDIDSLLTGLSWIQANVEVRELLQWLRRHNETRPPGSRVRFVGIDSQLDMWNIPLHREILARRAPAAHDLLRSGLDALEAHGRIDYRTLGREDAASIGTILDEMARAVAPPAAPDARGSAYDRNLPAHLVECLQRSHAFLLCAYQGENDLRDSHLALNSLWVGRMLGAGVPYTIWAHNAHVADDPEYYGPDGACSMGHHLRTRLGDGYYRLGTAFARGAFKAVRAGPDGKDTPPLDCEIRSAPPGGSINYLLSGAGRDRFVLSLRDLTADAPLFRFLDRERPFLGVGDFLADDLALHYDFEDRRINVVDGYDALAFFTDTRCVRLLPGD